jgi:hypothetical protein
MLAQALYSEGAKLVSAAHNPMNIKQASTRPWHSRHSRSSTAGITKTPPNERQPVFRRRGRADNCGYSYSLHGQQ